MFNSSFINFETSVLLKESGFNRHTDYCITQYPDDYVYDDDPEHPSSHKAGEIRVYNFSWRGISSNTYPTISIADAVYYCRETLGYNIYPVLGNDDIWHARIQTLGIDGKWVFSNIPDKIVTAKPNENTAEDVLNEAIIVVLQMVISNNENIY